MTLLDSGPALRRENDGTHGSDCGVTLRVAERNLQGAITPHRCADYNPGTIGSEPVGYHIGELLRDQSFPARATGLINIEAADGWGCYTRDYCPGEVF